MMKINCDMAQEYYLQQTIKDKLQGYSFQHPKCNASVVLILAVELQQIKEDIAAVGAGEKSMYSSSPLIRPLSSKTTLLISPITSVM
jgi:hypothetical protein